MDNPIQAEYLAGAGLWRCVVTTDKEGQVITYFLFRSKTAVKIINYFVGQSH